MKFSPIVFLMVLSIAGRAQSLSSLNYSYWYDPNAELRFEMTPVRTGGNFLVYYELTANRKDYPIDLYSISWQKRSSFTDRSEEVLNVKDSVLSKTPGSKFGVIKVSSANTVWYLVAKIMNATTQGAFHFIKPIDQLWPVNNLVVPENVNRLDQFFYTGSSLKLVLKNDQPKFAFVYKLKFSPAPPPFAGGGSTDPFFKTDSVFNFSVSFTPKSEGLYLIQADTTSSEGITFRVADASFPRYTRVGSLVAPLIYITTDDEYQQLTAAGSNKSAFDKVILEITRDKDRARNLMRSYFQRVEAANTYFTDYKEGWKTDRGMIYIIYGPPDEVSRTTSAEIWFYRDRKSKLIFNRTGSIFGPETYRLQRDSRYQEEWFSLVDLWRKSRF